MFSSEINFIHLILIVLNFFVVKKVFQFFKYFNHFLKLPKDPNCSFLFGDLLPFLPGFWNPKWTPIALTNFMISNASNHQIKSGLHACWFGWWPMVAINDHRSIEALISKSNISKPSFYAFTGLKEGLITSRGEKWKMRRKMIEPFFVSKQQKRFALTIDEVFDSLVNEDDFCNQGKYLTLSKKVVAATSDMIMKVTTDLPLGSEKEEKLHVTETIKLMEMTLLTRLCNPLIWSDNIFNATELGKKCTNMTNRVYKFVDLCVDQNLKHQSTDIDQPHSTKSHYNFVNMLRSSNKGNRLEIQEKLYQEISSVFDDNDSVNDIEKVNKCEYLDKCIKESMRLYPPVPVIARELDEPMEINSYYLPKGTTIAVNIFSIQRDPRIYPNPTEYDPERFDPSNLPNIPKGAYIPFGVTPRNCIGFRFALIEMKIFLIHLIRKYEIFSARKLEDVALLMKLMLNPSCPLEIKLQKRIDSW
ncbi:cytochrome P450 4V2-like isoform X2 [Panonychus citri]|uniref:cytochrome P450 4V2-like isoform X2 n=1 Tax=Panonychus citri TaxID=50023 RepID=UPI002307C2AD|nr:cytochrome P450 4V2-like isoform X2 [Panonychus citri]XP_053205070.1 cytochrome P450 4V2-like isoform X2 [Panonychus citri]